MQNVRKRAMQFGDTPAAKYMQEFGRTTTLHGIPYILRKNYHYSETLLWLVAVVLATYYAAKLIYDSWNRYSSNPTVISLEKDFREWNLTFPAATVCFTDRLNDTRASEFIFETWNVDQNSSIYGKYHSFLNAITNLTYDNLKDFIAFERVSQFTSLTGEQLSEIARQNMMQMEYHANVFDPAYNYLAFREIITEMGICFTYSGIVANYHTLKKLPQPSFEIPYCNYLTSVCYARVEDLPGKIRYYIHSPYEIPAVSDKFFEVFDSMERDTSWRFSEMIASPELRRLDPRQRQCRFVDEPLENEQVYSYNLCQMGCRKRLAYRLCGCAPYFYQKDGKIPVCGVKGLACLSKYKDEIVKLSSASGSPDCQCLSQCEYVTFYIDENQERTWTYPVPPNIRFRWAIQHYSKTRQKRDIIFGFEDLLVSLGGTAALFLGCSVLSFVEIGYFATLRLFWHLVRWHCGRKNGKNTRKRRVHYDRRY
ncbi:Amiloride-sensitive sodium channel [Nesidiocoris tenuis]|uniref:Amiloride-sensitive sodium channel n=1 Tax=Nesidiocoris tenuis TaxID=355587 RepID=A0ABN7BF33_9HEMI|nr:Amiloride-sensitive sodium channel [Nesidiocoris tenuis]